MGKKVIAVYRIRNVVSNKFYIGSSADLYTRWRTHKKKLRKNTHPNPHLQASWNKHGEDVFKFEKLDVFDNVPDMERAEQKLIDEHWDDPLFLNLAKWVGAPMRGRTGEDHPNFGIPLSEEQKELQRKAAKEQWEKSDPRTGRKHKDSTKAKISTKVQKALAEGRGGKFIPTDETRKKMSESLKGNQNAKGHVRTEEHRNNLSEALKGNQNWLGKKHTAESKAKMGKAIYGFHPSGGHMWFPTLSEALRYYDVKMPTLRRALKSGRPISKGKLAGYEFSYEHDA